MAHHFKIEVRPHINKDGSESKSKKDYAVVDRTRQGVVEVGVCSSAHAAEDLIAEERMKIIQRHLKTHKNDIHFINKHRLGNDG